MSNSNLNKFFSGFDDQTKRCAKCLKELPLGAYSKGSGGNYLRSECRNCARKHSGIVNTLRKSLTPPSSDYKCPICNRTEDEVKGQGGKKVGAWCCDHDHTTHLFRGWLCHQCNRAVGGMNDDVSRLEAAIKYLKRHKGDNNVVD